MKSPSDRRHRLALQARLIDLGHTVDEATTNRVMERLDPDRSPNDADLHKAASDEATRQAIQKSFA